MDASSIDNTSDSGAGSETDEQIPMAVPVVSVVATTEPNDDVESDDAAAAAGGNSSAAALDAADDETGSVATDATPPPGPSSAKRKRSGSEAEGGDADGKTDSGKKKKAYNDGRPRQPAAKGLTIPFRTIKRIMKIDSTIGIVQNDAAIVTTAALEHFVKQLATRSLEMAQKKGRNTIKYDDVAEVRAGDKSLSFLDLLIP